MADDGTGPVFPAAPPERMELPGGRSLARWRPELAAACAAAVNESLEHLRPWMAWAQEPATEAGLAVLFAAGHELWEQRRDFGYSILDAEGVVIGGSGLHGRLDEHGLEIGYWVHVDHIGRGVATDTAGALTDAAFTIPGVERVRIQCDEGNTRSARVPAKLGYRQVQAAGLGEATCADRSTQIWLVDRDAWIARRREVAS
jgi:RimJ/RimL family protein N-acetyltransferase